MRAITMMQAQCKVMQQTGEELSFEECKGGYFSVDEKYSLKVLGKHMQGGVPTPDAPLPIKKVQMGTKIRCRGKNLLNTSDESCSFSLCALNDDGSVRLNLTNAYYSEIRIKDPFVLNLLQENIGKTISFSCDTAKPDRYHEIVIHGKRTSGATYKAIIGNAHSKTASGTIGHDFTEITSIALRLLRSATPITDQDSVIGRIQLELGEASKYQPYCEYSEITVPCDLYEGDVWYPMSGKVIRKNAMIESYAGESVSDEYLSTTGGLDIGATVVYRLGEPIIEQYDPQPIFAPLGTAIVEQEPMEEGAELSATMLVRR